MDKESLLRRIMRFYLTRAEPFAFNRTPICFMTGYHGVMSDFFLNDTEQLRAEIAASAARLIAEDGADYSSAKRKAAKLILGDKRPRADILPSNAQIEDEVRIYNELFFGDSQPARLLHLRTLALQIMEGLSQFSPYLVGAVLNGTAGMHSDIHLQLFADNSKEVEMFLLNKNIQYEVSEQSHFKNPHALVPTLSFLVPHKGNDPDGVHLFLYDPDDLRGGNKSSSGKRIERANIDAVRQLLSKDIP